MDEKKPSLVNEVKPADALGTLSRRARASRFSYLALFLVGFVVLAFLAGLIGRSLFGGGSNVPDVPRVEL